VAHNALVRLYLVNVLEYDLINSFHLHGNLFNYFPTGTSLQPSELTDTVMQCQGQRGILEMRFPHLGKFMFHAHQSEFTELGWMGSFDVCDDSSGKLVCDLPGRPDGCPRRVRTDHTAPNAAGLAARAHPAHAGR